MLIAHSALVVIAFNDGYDNKRVDRLAYPPVEFDYMETPAKTSIIAARQPVYPGKVLKKATFPKIAISVKIESDIIGSYTESPFWYQQFDLQQIRVLRGGQPIVDFDAADNCCLYVTTMKAMNFKDGIPSIPVDNFTDHRVLVFDLTPMQDATETCHYRKLVGDPLRLELNFTFPLEHVTELIVPGERMSFVSADKNGNVGKNI